MSSWEGTVLSKVWQIDIIYGLMLIKQFKNSIFSYYKQIGFQHYKEIKEL